MLLASAKNGVEVQLCVVCEGKHVVTDLHAGFVVTLRAALHSFKDEVDDYALYLEKVFLRGPDQVELCYDCLLGLCEVHGVKTITITLLEYDEKLEEYPAVEFFVNELLVS